MASKKSSHPKNDDKDYLRLPFEVFYPGPISVTSYEFKSDVDVKRFKDIKAVHMEQGRSWGVTFLCAKNEGPQLYCCLTQGHDEVSPDWLELQDEENVSMNYGRDYKVVISGKEIFFVDEDIDDLDNLDYCGLDAYWHYEIATESPEFFILDALNTRIKVNIEGYPIDEDGVPTGAKRIINLEKLNIEDFEDYSTTDIWDAKYAWIQSQLEKYFPNEKSLSLSSNSL